MSRSPTRGVRPGISAASAEPRVLSPSQVRASAGGFLPPACAISSSIRTECTMGIIGTIIVGLIVGALARFVLPGDQKMGWIMTCLLGIAGSVVAGFVGQGLGWYAV